MDTWSFLDTLNIKVYCICLKTRDDRYISSLREFEKVGLLSRVQYYRPEKEADGRSGCWHSHKAIICLDNNKKLIFEDDVKFKAGWRTQISAVEAFLRDHTDWDIFRLGAFVIKILKPEEAVSLADCFFLHAYFIHEDYVAKLKKSRQYSPTLYRIVYNDYFHRQNARSYVLNKQICYQDNALGSDNGIFSRLFRYVTVKVKRLYNPFYWALFCMDFAGWILRSARSKFAFVLAREKIDQ